MRVNHILSAILRGPFAVQHETVHGYLPLVARLLMGEAQEPQAAGPPPGALGVVVAAGTGTVGLVPLAVRSRYKSYDDAAPDSVAVIAIKGVMMKADQWGLCEDMPGTASLLRAIQEADGHANIAAIVLDFDSGGGAVDGMLEFNAGIAACQKSVVAYSDGIIGSAAYCAASGTRLIVLNNNSCTVGSVGVMASLVDYQPVLEKMGVNFHTLRATGSERKNEDFYQLLAGNHKPYTAHVLTPLKEMMHSAVRAGRGKKLNEKSLQGDMYFAQEAIAMGLADEIGGFAYAVNRALELANAAGSGDTVEEEIETDPGNPDAPDALHDDDEDDLDEDPNATQLPTNTMFGKNKYPAVGALAGLTGAALTPALLEAANTELEAAGIEGAALISASAHETLSASAAALATAAGSLKAHADALASAGAADVAALAAQRDEWKAKAEKFGEQPGALGTSATKEKADVSEEGGDDNAKLVDALHAKMLGI